ncbi:Cytochrome P450 [Dillenia turbinata]|uniref:Cytochrome P450 n=1 Tax=Dillenia turbinata TaxID=194707 RepID=A0AAN8VQU8_9MAGN
MDLIFFLYVLTLVASLCLPILLSYYMHGLKHSNTNLPPGKMGWPIMGETLEYTSLARDGKPENFIRDRMEKYSSEIFKTSLLGDNMVVFYGPACNKFIFSSENKFVAGWWPSTVQKPFGKPSPSLSLSLSASSNSKKIKELREFLPPFLKIESTKKYAPLMDSMTMQYLEKKIGVTSKKIFLNIKDPDHIARIAKSFTTVLAGLVSLPIDFPSITFHQAIKATKVLQAEIKGVQIMEKGNAVGNNDISSHMLHIRSNEGTSLNDSEIANDIIQLLAASHETTSSAITFTLKHLADHPHIYHRVFEDT